MTTSVYYANANAKASTLSCSMLPYMLHVCMYVS